MKRFITVVAVVGWITLLGAVWIAAGTFGAAMFAESSVHYLLMVPLPFLIAGTWLYLRKPDNRSGWLLVSGTVGSLTFSAFLEQWVRRSLATAEPVPVWVRHGLAWETLAAMGGLAALSLLIALFPTGQVRVRREALFARSVWWLPVPMAVSLLANRHLPLDAIAYGDLQLENPYHLSFLAELGPATESMRYFLGSVLVVAIGLLLFRYREAPARERRQIRWVLFGATAAITVGILPFLVAPVLWPGSIGHGAWLFASTASLLFIPASVVIAVEQPRWIDTDAVIRKSIIYGVLTVGIFLVYAAVATGLGLAAGARLPVELAIGLTAVLAIAFQPTRSRMQLVADRIVFGSRPTAMEAVAGFEEAVRASQDPGEIGLQLAELVRTAARLHWVTVDIPPTTPTTVGTAAGEPVLVESIRRNDDEYGTILCGPRIAGQFGDRERDLVRALAGQAGLILANLRLAGRLVRAQETERRRIERDIHDGAQQELVALVAKLGLARSRVRDGSFDETSLIDLQHDARAILRDLREFAQGIHPSVLSDGGLVEAIQDRCARLPLDVNLETNIGRARFADDIEGAIYFFASEALTNILKHAEATEVDIRLHLVDGRLELKVTDDGHGFNARGSGTGLTGLADRFEALGGSVAVQSREGHGTTVTGRLPLDRTASR